MSRYSKRAGQENTSAAELLLSEAHLSKQEIGESLSRFYHVPYVNYDPGLQIPEELLQGISIPYLRKNCWVPISGDSSEVTVLIDDPTDIERILEIRRVIRAERTGYRGRVAIHELLVVNQDLKSMIHNGETPDGIRDAAVKGGMRTLLQDGISKVCLGLTDMEQVTRVAAKPL